MYKRELNAYLSISNFSDEKGGWQKKIGFTDTAKKNCRLDKHLLCMAVKHKQWS
jgi:hypothetical protein